MKKFLLIILILVLLGLITVTVVLFFYTQNHFRILKEDIAKLRANFSQQITTNQQQLISQLDTQINAVKEQAASNMKTQITTRLTAQGIYWNGNCVPAPQCPDNSKPEIYLVPLAIISKNKNQPISTFSAFAVGNFQNKSQPGNAENISNCEGTQIEPCTDMSGQKITSGNKYWRTCINMQAIESKKNKKKKKNTSKNPDMQNTVAAFTQCSISN